MTNIRFDNITDYRDIVTRNGYTLLKSQGGNLPAYIHAQKRLSRDNGRTPFQWDTTSNAGFTTGTPWLKVNPNYKVLNRAVEEKDPNSVLNYFRKVMDLRKQHQVLVYGQ